MTDNDQKNTVKTGQRKNIGLSEEPDLEALLDQDDTESPEPEMAYRLRSQFGSSNLEAPDTAEKQKETKINENLKSKDDRKETDMSIIPGME